MHLASIHWILQMTAAAQNEYKHLLEVTRQTAQQYTESLLNMNPLCAWAFHVTGAQKTQLMTYWSDSYNPWLGRKLERMHQGCDPMVIRRKIRYIAKVCSYDITCSTFVERVNSCPTATKLCHSKSTPRDLTPGLSCLSNRAASFN